MRRDEEEVKAFNINVYIQLVIGAVISGFFVWAGSTLWDYQIHKASTLHLSKQMEIMNAKIDLLNNKIISIEQKTMLIEQNLKYLNNQRQDMKGMGIQQNEDRNRPPLMTHPLTKDIVQKTSASCDGDECTQPPVDPPKPKPTKPIPAAQ